MTNHYILVVPEQDEMTYILNDLPELGADWQKIDSWSTTYNLDRYIVMGKNVHNGEIDFEDLKIEVSRFVKLAEASMEKIQ